MAGQFLENMLRVWEDTVWGGITGEQLNTGRKSGFDVSSLRKRLMQIRPFEKLPDIIPTFVEPIIKDDYAAKPLSLLPIYLAAWMSSSRRVFSLSREAAALTLSMSMKNLMWEDIHPPFQVFCIEFEQPIQIDSFEFGEVDFVIVFFDRYSNAPGEPPEICRFFLGNSRVHDARFVTDKRRMQIEKHIKRNRTSEAARLVLDSVTGLRSTRFLCFGVPMEKGLSVAQTFEHNFESSQMHFYDGSKATTKPRTPGMKADMEKLVHMSVCFSAFIGHLGKTKYLKSQEHRVVQNMEGNFRSRGKRVLTDGSMVCTIESTIRMPESGIRAIEGAGTREVSPHFRRGGWRKPKGSFDDPTARKTMPFAPTFVRLDRLGKDEQAEAKRQLVT
jgi:hypothetical protein